MGSRQSPGSGCGGLPAPSPHCNAQQQINTIIDRNLQPLGDGGCSGAAGIQIHSGRSSFLLLFHQAAARSRTTGPVWLRALSPLPCTLDGYSWMLSARAAQRHRGAIPALPRCPQRCRIPSTAHQQALGLRRAAGPLLLHGTSPGKVIPTERGGCSPVPAASEPSAALPCGAAVPPVGSGSAQITNPAEEGLPVPATAGPARLPGDVPCSPGIINSICFESFPSSSPSPAQRSSSRCAFSHERT